MSPVNVSDNPVCESKKEDRETQMNLPIPDEPQTPDDTQTRGSSHGYDAFPTLIRGCAFDAHWEFDMPTIIYFPFFKYGDGGNSGHLYQMVENLCIDLAVDGSADFAAMQAELEHECKWRRWAMRGFAKRKEAWHVEFAVRWYSAEGETRFDLDVTRKQRGPFKPS